MTDTYELPELPDRRLEPGTMRWGIEYTAAEMKEYARLAVKAERERAERFREVLEMLAAQGSGIVGSTARADCMAAMAAAAIRKG